MRHRMPGGDRAPFRPLDIGVVNVDGKPGNVVGCATARVLAGCAGLLRACQTITDFCVLGAAGWIV